MLVPVCRKCQYTWFQLKENDSICIHWLSKQTSVELKVYNKTMKTNPTVSTMYDLSILKTLIVTRLAVIPRRLHNIIYEVPLHSTSWRTTCRKNEQLTFCFDCKECVFRTCTPCKLGTRNNEYESKLTQRCLVKPFPLYFGLACLVNIVYLYLCLKMTFF